MCHNWYYHYYNRYTCPIYKYYDINILILFVIGFLQIGQLLILAEHFIHIETCPQSIQQFRFSSKHITYVRSSGDSLFFCKKLIIVRVNTPFEQTKDLIDSGIFPELQCHDDIRILPQFVHSRKELNTMTVKWDDYDWWKRQIEIERGYGKFLLRSSRSYLTTASRKARSIPGPVWTTRYPSLSR